MTLHRSQGAIPPEEYREFILQALEQKSPILLEELYDRLYIQFSPRFEDWDNTKLRGKKTPVWQNFVAHALALLTKRKLILTGFVDDAKWVVLRQPIYEKLLEVKKVNCFKRKCDECGVLYRLAPECPKCGAIYNPIPQRQVGE